MKFHLQGATGHTVTGMGPGWVRVGAVEYRTSLLLAPDTITAGWASGGFDALTEADFAAMLSLDPEVALLGTGARQRFPHPRLYAALTTAGIGLESMDSAAACRTFNILAAEGRRVAMGLLLEPPAP